MGGPKVWQPMLVLVLLHVSVEIMALCPAGYVESMGMCVPQTSPTCPPNYVLRNGLCYPATSSSSTNNLSPPVIPCTTQQNQPCATQLFPSPWTQPVHPCPVQPVQPCPNQPIQPVQPCPNQPIQPVQPCPNQPIQPVQPCANQPIQPVQPCPNQPIQPVQPWPVQPVTTTAPTPRETTRTTTYPPDPLMRCPEGTALINGVCRLIYCGKGVYKDHKCVQIQCRPGTVWTGVQCASPIPIVQSIVLNNTVITHFNRTAPDVVVNNVNNLVVDAGSFTAPNCTDVDSGEATPSCPDFVTPPPHQTNCCAVVTPRMCRRSEAGDHWNCFSKRYRRCGDFCIAPTIYLKPPMIRDTNSGLVMPPDHALSDCRRTGTCAESINYHDCSGCAMGMDENCSSYCSKSTCGTGSCRFYDQQLYCGRFPGQEGCQETDGCVDDWCSSD